MNIFPYGLYKSIHPARCRMTMMQELKGCAANVLKLRALTLRVPTTPTKAW